MSAFTAGSSHDLFVAVVVFHLYYAVFDVEVPRGLVIEPVFCQGFSSDLKTQ
jgi:hypothetical protein